MTTLQQIDTPPQAGAPSRTNENFDTLSAAAIFGMDPETTTGLIWGFKGGYYNGNTKADGTVTQTDNATNYVVVLRSTGVVSVSTSSTNSLDPLYAKLYTNIVAGGVVTNEGSNDRRWDANGLFFTPGATGSAGDMILASAQTVTGAKTFGSAGAVGKLKVAGTTSGAVTLDAPAVAGSGTVTLPVSGTLATQAYVDNAVTGLWDVKGGTDCSANPNYPSALKGDAYAVTVAGKIGGASGTSVDVGDVYVAILDNAGGTEASVGTSWIHIEHNLAGVYVAGGTDVAVADGGTGASTAAGARANLQVGWVPLMAACSDETTALTTGTNKVKFINPYSTAFNVMAVVASLSTAQASGSIFTVDINEAGTSILSTKLSIDNTETNSSTAATAAVISDASIAAYAEIEVDIDQVGDGTAKGLKVYVLGYPS